MPLNIIMSLDNSDNNNGEPPAILYDALPYIDATHEDYDVYAAHLIEEEMKRLPPEWFVKDEDTNRIRRCGSKNI